MNKDARQIIEELRDQIRRHDYLYYVLNQPQITDQQYDQLFTRLKKIESEYPELIAPDSPTQRVSEQPLEAFDQIAHSVPMLSIDNTYNPDELIAFDQRIAKALAPQKYEYVVEPKIDGLAISLRYEDGLLKTAATRGNGQIGDNVTQNIRTIKAVPLTLLNAQNAPQTIEVRGEVYMPLKAFQQLNDLRAEAGEQFFANPRNAAAGSLKLLDPKITAARNLSFFAYSVGQISEPIADGHYDTLQRLKDFGFPVNENIKKADSIENVIKICNDFTKKRLTLDYMIDGMVIKVNNLVQHDLLGSTGRAPKWCISYKFPAQQAQTIVRSIDVQVGKTGTLTPVANLEPVLLAGTTVKRASLHNFDELNRLDVRCGDTVLVEKAGEIIPQVVEVKKEFRPDDAEIFKKPTICPSCGEKIEVRTKKRTGKKDEIAHKSEKTHSYICTNKNCTTLLKEKINYFVGRDQMNIEDVGPSLIEQLVEAGLVKNFADIYKLTKEDIVELERIADKSADNIVKAIRKSKIIPLWRFLAGLGIRHIGGQSAQTLSNYFGTIEKVLSVDEDELKKIKKQEKDEKKLLKNKLNRQEIGKEEHKEKLKELQKNEKLKDIGDEIIDSFCNYMKDTKNKTMIEELISVGVKPESSQKIKSKEKLAGKTFVVTGTFTNFSRQQIEQEIRDAGGKTSSSVSKITNFVLAGENPGSKLNKARQLQVKVINENEFLQLIHKKTSPKKEGHLWE